MNAWDRCYCRHFTNYLGKPFDRETYSRDPDSWPLSILTFDQRYAPRYRVYASVGLTAYEGEVQDLAEAIVVADAGAKPVPFLFVNALFFVIQQRIALSSRFAVGGVEKLDPPFAALYDKSALYFAVVTPADEFDKGFERVECEGDVGLIYQGTFISPDEHEYLRRHGADAFEEKFRAQDADLCSLWRPSCV